MSVLEMDNDRKLFTNHSLHLKGQGKEVLFKLIVSHTYSILERKIDPPIILYWKSDQNLTVLQNQVKVINRTSTRPRKTPSMKSDFFFMVKRDLSVGDNSLINGSIKVTRSLRIQKENLKCKKQGPKSLRWQPQASNDTLSNSNETKSFTVFHQKVRGLLNKLEELISFMYPDFPQVLCLTEHHLKLGTKFCRESIKNGGVSIFVHDILVYKY